MKVAIISPIHNYLDIRIFQKQAVSLATIYEVILIAQADSEKDIKNVKVIPAPRTNNILKRLLNQPILLLKALRLKADIYHLHNPDTLPIGFILKLLGKKVIYDTHEDFSKRILMREWIPSMFRNVISQSIEKVEKIASLFFDGFIVTQMQQKEKIGNKTVVLENAPLVSGSLVQKAYEISKTIEKGPFIRLVYVGGITKARGIREVIVALGNVNFKVKCRLWLIGPSSKEFVEELKELDGWKYVDYLGRIPQEEAFAFMNSSDIGIVTILNIGDHPYTSPNKLFEYQLFRLPFIASDFSVWREMVGKTNSGFFVDPDNISEIEKKIILLSESKVLRDEMGGRGQSYVINTYNWERESMKLYFLYESLS